MNRGGEWPKMNYNCLPQFVSDTRYRLLSFPRIEDTLRRIHLLLLQPFFLKQDSVYLVMSLGKSMTEIYEIW